jgi:hypothetical protein
MAKPNKTVAEEAELKATNVQTISRDEWDNLGVPEIGGQSDILIINQGEASGPFIYTGHRAFDLQGKQVTGHSATLNGEQYRLPISASFTQALDQAGIHQGDEFYIRRGDDQAKKNGVGKGTMMAIYAIKVTKRAAQQPA